MSQTSAYNGSGSIIKKLDNKDDDEKYFNEKNYIDYDEDKEGEKGIIDLKLFVEVCKTNFPNVNPIEMFDMIILGLIYCYKL